MKKHVTLLSRLRRDTLEDFTAAGIKTLDQIVAMQPDDLRGFRGIKTSANAVHAHARAWVEERPAWYGALHPSCRMRPGYFDIETRVEGQNVGEVWSIGWRDYEGDIQNVIVSSVADVTPITLPDQRTITLVPDAASAWRVFAASASVCEQPIFHWTSFDAAVMKRTAPRDVTRLLSPYLCDLCKVFDDAVKLPVKGVSLKTVAPYLGFAWQGYEDWYAAWSDYLKWQRTGSIDALASATAYQRDDVEAMVVVQRWLAANAPEP
jgi:predicted RecB family nuclease